MGSIIIFIINHFLLKFNSIFYVKGGGLAQAPGLYTTYRVLVYSMTKSVRVSSASLQSQSKYSKSKMLYTRITFSNSQEPIFADAVL